MAYKFANPNNGSEYTPIELNAIWEIPVDLNANLFGFESPMGKRWSFFMAAAHYDNNPFSKTDAWAVSLIERAVLAEHENPVPADYPYDPEDGA